MTYINHIKMVQLLITLQALYFPGLMFIFYVPQNDRPGPPGPKGAKGHRGPEGNPVSAPLHVFSMCPMYIPLLDYDKS